MKAYNKPEFYVTEFVPNQAVSVCPEETLTADTMVKVNCVISGSHSIFYDNCAKVSEGADYDNLTVVKDFYTKSGNTTTKNDYLVWGRSNNVQLPVGEIDATTKTDWKGSSAANAASSKGSSLIDALVDLILGKDQHDYQKYHAGVITPDVYKVRNSSI